MADHIAAASSPSSRQRHRSEHDRCTFVADRHEPNRQPSQTEGKREEDRPTDSCLNIAALVVLVRKRKGSETAVTVGQVQFHGT